MRSTWVTCPTPDLARTTPSAISSSIFATLSRARLVEQSIARRCCSLAQLNAADLDRQAGVGRPLVGRQGGIAFNDIHLADRKGELFGDDLRQGRAHAGAEINLARVDRYRSSRIYCKKGIDLGECEGFARALSLRTLNVASDGKRNDQRTGGFKKLAP